MWGRCGDGVGMGWGGGGTFIEYHGASNCLNRFLNLLFIVFQIDLLLFELAVGSIDP